MKLIALLSGIMTLPGAYLFFSEAGIVRWLGLAVLAIGLVLLVLCYSVVKQHERNVDQLHLQIMDFLEGRDKTPRFSVDDDTFAILKNAVIELENRLLVEHDNTQRENKKNADFITDVSHQLKTPLAALKLYCEMDSADCAYNEKQIVLIERMEYLIYSLLRLEKLRADAYEMQFTENCFSQLVKQVWDDLLPLFPGKHLSVNGNAQLRCDDYWMGEALKNILKNCCEHTEHNGTINVFIEQTDMSVLITVEDDGGGLPQEELPKLFQRFYRSSCTLSKGGAGIGLAITRTIVEKHHGTISAENTPKGLKMNLCFPILDGVMSAG